MPNSLIDELQLGAANPAIPVTALLRKALMVAAKLELPGVPEWINKELSGSKGEDTVPEYRIMYGSVKARNPFHGWIPVQFPTNDLQNTVSRYDVVESVAEIEALTERDGTLVHSFPSEAQRALQQMFQQNAEFTSRNRPQLPPPARERIPAYNAAIDGAYYTIDIRGQTYSTSEILYPTDYEAYREIGVELSQAQRDDMALH
jgi:hypothetical protein